MLVPLILEVTPAPPFKPEPAFCAPPPPPAPQLLTCDPQLLPDEPIVPPANPFPLGPPVSDVRSGATPPLAENAPKLDDPPSVPLSGVNPAALSDSLVPPQLIRAAEPPAPTVTGIKSPGVNDRVPKETPPPPPPAP